MQVELEISELLVAWRMGDADALNRLFPLVYEESSGSPVGNGLASAVAAPLTTTALVHETYLRLVDQTGAEWADRAHFLAIAARAMRRLLIDHARRHQAAKRGGAWRRVTLDVDQSPAGARSPTPERRHCSHSMRPSPGWPPSTSARAASWSVDSSVA